MKSYTTILTCAFLCLLLPLSGQLPAFYGDTLLNPHRYVSFWEKVWEVTEVSEYTMPESENCIILPNAYASAVISDTYAWPPDAPSFRVKEISMVLTRYPVNKDFWRTNYYQLMADRLKELFRLDPSLNDQSVRFRLIFQTNCKTEKEAKNMFHGFEVCYEEEKTDEQDLSVFDTLYAKNEDSLYWINARQKMLKQIRRSGGLDNPVVMKGLDDMPLDSALIVIDCTGSMHPYIDQVLLWLTENVNDQNHFFALFTDANLSYSRGRNFKRVYTGVYDKISGLQKLLKKARGMAGLNREPEENDMEGVLTGIREYPFVKSVILIADNNSFVKDINWLQCVKIPVNVIPCGVYNGFNPHYVHIAAATGGKIFSEKSGWTGFSGYEKEVNFILDGVRYKYHRKQNIFHSYYGKTEIFTAGRSFYKKKSPCDFR